MNEEEWQFLIIVVGTGVLAAAVIINDFFSIQKFWFRWTRSRKPPTPESIAKAYMRHQRFYHHTEQSLFETTYVSFYLFVLSYIGLLIMAALFFIQDTLQGISYNTDERLLPFFWILPFFLLSRWYYRQEIHHVTIQKLFTILSCFLFVDFVHRITGLDYVQIVPVLLILWIWMIGAVRAVVGYEVNYVRTITLSFCIPVAALALLTLSSGIMIYSLFIPGIIVTSKEFITKSTHNFNEMKKIFPNPLPFRPGQPDSFLGDVAYSSHFRETFRTCSVWEVFFWFFMTPVVLVPVMQYLQGREEQLHQWHDDLVKWSQNEYVLNPDTVADKLGLTLMNTYPLLNELTDEGKLTLYESTEGLLYGLPPSEEMEAFVTRLNLQKADLPGNVKDLLEYLWEKGRTRPPRTVLLSVIQNSGIEVSYEFSGGTVSALKSTTFLDTGEAFKKATLDINRLVSHTIWTLSNFGKYTLRNPRPFLSILEKKGRNLLDASIPPEITEGLEMSHIVLETNMDDTPLELMYSYTFFALKYAVGRRLRVTGSAKVRTRIDIGRLRAVIIGDPQCTLNKALIECQYLNKELSRLIETLYLPQEKATWEEVTKCLIEGYSIIHYAGHADEKGLHLSDNILDPDTIETLLWGNPVVFINGCNSARTHTKLAEAFLRGGALGYIGSVWEIHDAAAAQLATDFYTASFEHSIGEALRRAKVSAFYKNNVAWLCFILFGDPTLRLI